MTIKVHKVPMIKTSLSLEAGIESIPIVDMITLTEHEQAMAEKDQKVEHLKVGKCLKCNMGPLRESCAYPEACEHPGRELAYKLNQALLTTAEQSRELERLQSILTHLFKNDVHGEDGTFTWHDGESFDCLKGIPYNDLLRVAVEFAEGINEAINQKVKNPLLNITPIIKRLTDAFLATPAAMAVQGKGDA